MNIQEAKEEIARTFRLYTKTNADGSPCIPVEKQRPLLLIGPPGIGKTAIMKQIAEETGCGLISYTMTHHTRQSAIGLPFISRKEYNGRTYSITEYTMSEIVASIYEYMEATGKTAGILFLDEVNCVSETLAPVMLQLLQNKTFGNHHLPPDWVIVAAGNPPEYNKSVRDFDMVTLDRVKNMEISADLAIWQTYAAKEGIHPAIRTYLTMYPEHFYNITNTDRGQLFVTARGWEDLSLMLMAYEEEDLPLRDDFFLEYLQHDEIARSFGLYYKMFRLFSPEEENSLPEKLLRDLSQLRGIPASSVMSIAAMLFHGISMPAQEILEEKKLRTRTEELRNLLPKEEDLRNDAARKAFFDKKREAVEIRVSRSIMKPAEELLERHALADLEKQLGRWLTIDSALSDRETENDLRFTAFADAEYAAWQAEMTRKEDAVLLAIDDAYTIVEAAPEGKSALLYLTTDIKNDPAVYAIVEERGSASFRAHDTKMP